MKADAAEFEKTIAELLTKPWLVGTVRAGWPKYLFRIDDVVSAAAALNCGSIYSRNRAIQLGVLTHDAAAPSVIGHSPEWIKDFVRLYFRPRTPTEYRSEGIRTASAITMGAHRPVPVVMALAAIPILTADGTQFTDGNAASASSKSGETAQFFAGIPFERVYHDGPVSGAAKQDIILRRCAEVLVPTQLALDNLVRVLCRTTAELETLIDLLDVHAKAKYSTIAGISDRVHFKFWTFVESVEKSKDSVTFRFNRSTASPGPFVAKVAVESLSSPRRGSWKGDAFQANNQLTISLGNLELGPYRVKLFLDDHLAYSGVFVEQESLI